MRHNDPSVLLRDMKRLWNKSLHTLISNNFLSFESVIALVTWADAPPVVSQSWGRRTCVISAKFVTTSGQLSGVDLHVLSHAITH